MSQEPFDHAYAFGVSNHVGFAVGSGTLEEKSVINKTVERHTETTENDTFTEEEVPEFQAVSEKVLVESVNAADLGAIHEKLIKSSPNKSWYLNGKNSDKVRNGSVSSSSTDTCESEVEQMEVDKDIGKENGEVEKDEIDGVTKEQDNPSISPTESAEYTPMSPVPMDEEPTEDGKQTGGNLLKEIENEQEPDVKHPDKDKTEGNDAEKSVKSSSSQEPQVNGFADHEYAKGDSDQVDKDPDQDDEETDVDDSGGPDQVNDLNETDQNVTQNSELNGSLDVSSDGVQTDSLDPGSEQRLVSPLLIKRKGRPKGRGRGRGKHRRWSQGWTRISPRKRSGDFSSMVEDAGENGFVYSLLDIIVN